MVMGIPVSIKVIEDVVNTTLGYPFYGPRGSETNEWNICKVFKHYTRQKGIMCGMSDFLDLSGFCSFAFIYFLNFHIAII